MTNEAPKQIDVSKEGSAAGSDTARDARENLSNYAIGEMMKDSMSSNSGKVGNELSKTLVPESASQGASVHEQAKDVNNMGNVLEKAGGGAISEVAKDISKGHVGIGKLLQKEVSDEQRAEAKKELGKELNDLVPDAERKTMTALQDALIDGDMKKFGDTLKGIPADQVDKYIKTLNENLDKNENFGGVDVTRDAKGNVLIYGEKGNTAISFDPKTGEATLKPIERQSDGSVVLKAGEIISPKADEVMKDLGDAATRSITDHGFSKPYEPKPWPPIGKPDFPPINKPDFPPIGKPPIGKPINPGFPIKPPAWGDKPAFPPNIRPTEGDLNKMKGN